MPELPEVECLARAVDAELTGQRFAGVRFLRRDLRDPIPMAQLSRMLAGTKVLRVWRRGKYLLMATEHGTVILHLGMSGQLLWQDSSEPVKPHTHVIFSVELAGSQAWLHFVDPRRFGRLGAVTRADDPLQHPWLRHLGPEPLELTVEQLAVHLRQASHGRKTAIKPFIMNPEIVVGVGNIYASESLYLAGIRPTRASGRLTRADWHRLAAAIQSVLLASIKVGGTSFRDYLHSDGSEGLYALGLNVYERKGLPCQTCHTEVREIRQGNRASYYCPTCQK